MINNYIIQQIELKFKELSVRQILHSVRRKSRKRREIFIKTFTSSHGICWLRSVQTVEKFIVEVVREYTCIPYKTESNLLSKNLLLKKIS